MIRYDIFKMGHPVYIWNVSFDVRETKEDVSQLNHCLLFIIAKSGSFHPSFSPLFFLPLINKSKIHFICRHQSLYIE